jgi:hypothetical protein
VATATKLVKHFRIDPGKEVKFLATGALESRFDSSVKTFNEKLPFQEDGLGLPIDHAKRTAKVNR